MVSSLFFHDIRGRCCWRALRPRAAVKRHKVLPESGGTNADGRALSLLQLSAVYAIIRHTKSTSSPRTLHDHSSSSRACATSVLNVLSSTRLQPFCHRPLVFHTFGSRHRSRFSRWQHWSWSCSGAWVSCGSQAEAGATASGRRAVGVAIMISDTRGLWHADLIRSVAAPQASLTSY